MKYQVTLIFNHTERGSVIVEADSREAARLQAEELTSDAIDYWEGLHGEIYVDAVTAIESNPAQQGRAGR